MVSTYLDHLAPVYLLIFERFSLNHILLTGFASPSGHKIHLGTVSNTSEILKIFSPSAAKNDYPSMVDGGLYDDKTVDFY